MPVLRCYLYNSIVYKVDDERCGNKEKCEDCIFAVRSEGDEQDESEMCKE